MRKNTLIILVMLIGVGLKSFGQKLEKRKSDDPLKRTTWESLFDTRSANAYFRILALDDAESFDLKYQDNTAIDIPKDYEIIFRLDNGELIKLPNIKYAVTCIGCGSIGMKGAESLGIRVVYLLNKDQIAKLKVNKIVSVSIKTMTRVLEGDVKEKNAAKVEGALMLVNN